MNLKSHRLVKFLPPILGLIVLAGIVYGLHGALAHVRPGDIFAALAATPAAQIIDAIGLQVLSIGVMAVYDIPGIRFARHHFENFPKLGARHVALASFCAYALSHVLGAPAITGAAIRLRLYAEWKVPPASIARIIALSGSSFSIGTFSLAGFILLFRPHDVPLFGRDISTDGLRLIGVLLWAVILTYIVLARLDRPIALFGKAIPLPGLSLAIAQVLLSCVDISLAGSVLFAVLPAVPGLTLPHVLAIYLAATAGGLFSGIPAGAGVLDTLLLLGLSPYVGAADAIGAILLFRVLYYLTPAGIAGLCFAAHEIFLTTKGSRP